MTDFPSNTVKIKRLNEDAIFPRYAKKGDAGLTLYSPISFKILPKDVFQVNMGYAIWIENEEWGGFVVPRSGKGTEGLVVANLTGVIDSSYQGQLIVQCWNRSDKVISINAGEGIAQMAILRVVTVTLREVEEFEKTTERGTGGFGSTDKFPEYI